MPDPTQAPRFVEGKDVIYQCRSNGWSRWAMELLDQAYKAGCKLRKTTSHHVMISNEVGMTTTLAGRNSSNGARSRRDTMKVITAQEEYKLRQATNDPTTPEPKPEPVEKKPARAFNPPPEDLEIPDDEPEVKVEVTRKPSCGLCDPPRYYDDDSKLEAHREETHWQCPECGDWLKSNKSAGGHIGVKHGNNKPWEAKSNFKGKKKTEEPVIPWPQPAVNPVDQLMDQLRGGNPAPTFSAGGPPPQPRLNGNGTRRSGPMKTIELPAPEVLGEILNDASKLERIREVLGEDPRIAELVAQNAALKARAEEAETKLSLMRGKIREAQEAADL